MLIKVVILISVDIALKMLIRNNDDTNTLHVFDVTPYKPL